MTTSRLLLSLSLLALAPAALASDTSPPPPSEPPALVEARPLTLPPPSGPGVATWYRPTGQGRGDAELPWNRSILGSFDPWTADKLVLLYARQKVDFRLAEATGTVRYPVATPGGAPRDEKRTYGAATLGATFSGGRLLWGEWSVTAGTGTALLYDRAPRSAPAYSLTLARSLGAWEIVGFGSPDIRVGIAWPELFLRVMFAKFEAGGPSAPALQQLVVSPGLTLLGIRLTVAEVFYAEVRGGEAAAFLHVTEVDPGGGQQKDLVQRSGSSFTFRPFFLAGLAL